MVSNRLVLAYLVLVGLPVLMLFSILETGRALVAPPAIAGDWSIDFEGTPATADTCSGQLANLPRPALSISQAGTLLTIALNDGGKTRFATVMEDGRLAGSAGRIGLAGGCSQDMALHLEASVNGKRGQRWLEGRFSFPGCASCQAVQFRANRFGPPGKQVR